MAAQFTDLKKTDEELFNALPIYRDSYGAAYVLVTYEGEYYLDIETAAALQGITEREEDAITDGASIGTLFYVGYNL